MTSSAAVVVTVPFTRNERGALAGLKTTSYAENVIALSLAKGRGASEALFANTRDELCEGTGSNVFLVRGEEVWTPPLESGCLAGVTRSLVLEICRREGMPVREEAIPFHELATAEEAFLTSTTREVQAIGEIDRRVLPTVEGAVTRRLAKRFRAWAAADADP
jgi:branched-chain amino acid aminotransferase